MTLKDWIKTYWKTSDDIPLDQLWYKDKNGKVILRLVNIKISNTDTENSANK